jgi:hypothetical protein
LKKININHYFENIEKAIMIGYKSYITINRISFIEKQSGDSDSDYDNNIFFLMTSSSYLKISSSYIELKRTIFLTPDGSNLEF